MEMECTGSLWKASLQTPVSLTPCKRNFLKGVPDFSVGFIKKQLLCCVCVCVCAGLEGRWTLFSGRMNYEPQSTETENFIIFPVLI